ncbi:MAG TPA: carboxypeptidase-like regulatory domain-containing protein, partial [Terriglobia bacterium]|nr:carboxypeptidase-like regulatory domain-containing protein [Terriglobia bacterium]
MSRGNWLRVNAFRLSVLLVFLLSIGTLALGQSINGGFHGVVNDSSGAVLPGATVEAKNQGTGLIRQATTTDVGYFTITQLPPGSY